VRTLQSQSTTLQCNNYDFTIAIANLRTVLRDLYIGRSSQYELFAKGQVKTAKMTWGRGGAGNIAQVQEQSKKVVEVSAQY
jgi:hypothetical protein